MKAGVMACRICGFPAKLRCYKCGADVCDADGRYYFDGNNKAVSENAKPECPMCFPPTYPRPYSWVRALERGEAELDWFPPGSEPLVPRPQ
jgi:ribosomal protein L37E